MTETNQGGQGSGGLFSQLAPMAAERTILMTISMADGGALCVTFIPKRLKPSEDEALVAVLCITGTPEELDCDLVSQGAQLRGATQRGVKQSRRGSARDGRSVKAKP